MQTIFRSQLIVTMALGACGAVSVFIDAYASESRLQSAARGRHVRPTTLSRQLAEVDDPKPSNSLDGAKRNSYGAPSSDIKQQLDRLVRAYPDAIERHDGVTLFMKNGAQFKISNNRTDKTFDELLAEPDIDDMFYVPYPQGAVPQQPAKNYDPGRVRFEPLFIAMYGDCTKHEVTKNVRNVSWLPKHAGGNLAITMINGVDKALEAISQDLDELPNDLIKYLKPSAGTYSCRSIAGTNNRSMHAYAAAVDINVKYSDYWRWGLGIKAEPSWHNQIPIEIVRIFEKHGFIWGGYWYHYDTMHFEYRPELLSSKRPADR
jgi:D-alanyl-D-alanine carboxypeptidase